MENQGETAVPHVGEPDRFNRTIHGARGLFASMVFIFHVVNSGLPTFVILQQPLAQFLLRTQEYGVELFFCISGYVISGTLRRAASPAAFLENRAVRIYPALWTSVLVILALGLASGERGFDALTGRDLAWRLPANLLALPGIVPMDIFHPAAWSLSYEMTFYTACALGWVCRRRFGTKILNILVPLGLLFLALYPRGIFLLSGVAVAEGALDRLGMSRLARHPIPALALFLISWRAIQALSWPQHITVTTLYQWADGFRLPLAVIAFCAATVALYGLAAGQGPLARALCRRPMQYMGTISYSFYLWSPVVMSLTKHAMVHAGLPAAFGPFSQLAFLVLAFPPSLILAHASQRVLERRAGRWLRRRGGGLIPPRPPSASVIDVTAGAETAGSA